MTAYMLHINTSVSFKLRNWPHLRGHRYVLNKESDFSTERDFDHRVINL